MRTGLLSGLLTRYQRKFSCEITGHSLMNFFDALKSEVGLCTHRIYPFSVLTPDKTAGSKEVDDSFPEPLREPVLRRVQFSTTSRIDNLGKSLTLAHNFMVELTPLFHSVDQVYDASHAKRLPHCN